MDTTFNAAERIDKFKELGRSELDIFHMVCLRLLNKSHDHGMLTYTAGELTTAGIKKDGVDLIFIPPAIFCICKDELCTAYTEDDLDLEDLFEQLERCGCEFLIR